MLVQVVFLAIQLRMEKLALLVRGEKSEVCCMYNIILFLDIVGLLHVLIVAQLKMMTVGLPVCDKKAECFPWANQHYILP